jgi:Flp pilus assembly protein TadD
MPDPIRSTLLPIVVAATCVMLAALLFINQRQAERLDDALASYYRGDHAGALRQASDVTRAPSRGLALLVAGSSLALRNRPAEASRVYSLAVHRDPNNWVLHRNWAVVLAALGKRSEASREMAKAVQLNPLLTLPPTFVRKG